MSASSRPEPRRTQPAETAAEAQHVAEEEAEAALPVGAAALLVLPTGLFGNVVPPALPAMSTKPRVSCVLANITAAALVPAAGSSEELRRRLTAGPADLTADGVGVGATAAPATLRLPVSTG